jgi:DNA polymerase-3 subunit epsilon
MSSTIDWPDAHVSLAAHPNPDDRRRAGAWALQRLVRRDFVVVDTETTGLGSEDQVIEVAVVDPSGKVLVEQLVRPTCPIHPRATAVHGYDALALATAPTFLQVLPKLRACLGESLAIAYNSPFDERLLRQSAAVWGAEPIDTRWDCAMRWYAQYTGMTSGSRGGYVSPKLPRDEADKARHGARRDCLLTLRLLTRMAVPLSG